MDNSSISREHPLALKVMRLTKPTFLTNHINPNETRDLPGKAFDQSSKNNLTIIENNEDIALSKFLTLPQNFGNIFLGEVFSSYISVHNDSKQSCKDVFVKTDLQTATSSTRTNLSTTPLVAELGSGQSIDDVINHEIKELGMHILVCTVQYNSPSGEKNFKKFFKFNVHKPLDVRTTFYNSPTDEMFLEAQIQNLTLSPMYLDEVSMHPSDNFLVKEYNAFHDDEDNLGKLINAQDVHQFVYRFKPKPHIYKDHKLLKASTQIGKLDIVWKTSLGERARLQTSALHRAAPDFGDLRVFIEDIPRSSKIEEKFTINLKLMNSSERSIDLKVFFHHSSSDGIKWCGKSNHTLDTLPSNGSTLLPFTLFPVKLGIQSISGLRILDTFLGRLHEFDDIATILVYNDKDNDKKLLTLLNNNN